MKINDLSKNILFKCFVVNNGSEDHLYSDKESAIIQGILGFKNSYGFNSDDDKNLLKNVLTVLKAIEYATFYDCNNVLNFDVDKYKSKIKYLSEDTVNLILRILRERKLIEQSYTLTIEGISLLTNLEQLFSFE